MRRPIHVRKVYSAEYLQAAGSFIAKQFAIQDWVWKRCHNVGAKQRMGKITELLYDGYNPFSSIVPTKVDKIFKHFIWNVDRK